MRQYQFTEEIGKLFNYKYGVIMSDSKTLMYADVPGVMGKITIFEVGELGEMEFNTRTEQFRKMEIMKKEILSALIIAYASTPLKER